MIVYKITNSINNKSYVGMTKGSLESRWLSHISSANQGSSFRFHAAIRKYGIDNWTKEILFESDNMSLIREKEADYILSLNLINFNVGYNSKPGGCGGWIVPEHKFKQWKQRLSERSSGLNNTNSLSVSNDELIEYGLSYIKEHHEIATGSKFSKYCLDKFNKQIPRFWSKYRFGGWSGFIKLLENKSGLTHNRYPRIKGRESLISIKLRGRVWISNIDLAISKTCKKEELENILNNGWKKGSLYGKNKKT